MPGYVDAPPGTQFLSFYTVGSSSGRGLARLRRRSAAYAQM